MKEASFIFRLIDDTTRKQNSSSKFKAGLFENRRYETMLYTTYKNANVAVPTTDIKRNKDWELGSLSAGLKMLRRCDGLTKAEKPLMKIRNKMRFQPNSQEVLDEVVYVQTQIWNGKADGFRADMITGLGNFYHQAFTFDDFDKERLRQVLKIFGPDDIKKRSNSYVADGKGRDTAIGYVIQRAYNNYQDTDLGLKKLQGKKLLKVIQFRNKDKNFSVIDED